MRGGFYLDKAVRKSLFEKVTFNLRTEEGKKQAQESVRAYLETAGLIRQGLSHAGLTAYGGENAPYVWAKTPDGIGSWDFFDLLLDKAGVIVTPGSGFGREGEGWFRITSFNDRARTAEAMERIKTCLNGL